MGAPFSDYNRGDALSYGAGPRWSPETSTRWAPHAQLIVGGTKITHKHMDVALGDRLRPIAAQMNQPNPEHDQIYVRGRPKRFQPSCQQRYQLPGKRGQQASQHTHGK